MVFRIRVFNTILVSREDPDFFSEHTSMLYEFSSRFSSPGFVLKTVEGYFTKKSLASSLSM